MNDTFLVKLLVHVGVAGGKLRDAMRDFDVIQQPKVAFFALDIVQNGSASGRFNDGFCFFAIAEVGKKVLGPARAMNTPDIDLLVSKSDAKSASLYSSTVSLSAGSPTQPYILWPFVVLM